MVMKMIEFVHDHGPRWIIATVRELLILSLKGSRILRFPFGLLGTYSICQSEILYNYCASLSSIYNIGVLTVNIEFMWRGLETGERTSFSESFHPFRAEPHKFYIYRQYTNIVFILQKNVI